MQKSVRVLCNGEKKLSGTKFTAPSTYLKPVIITPVKLTMAK